MSNTPAKTAARSMLADYGSPMAQKDHTADALDAMQRIIDCTAAVEKAREDRDLAMVRMFRAGMHPPAIARALTEGGHKISTSGVRFILRGHGINV